MSYPEKFSIIYQRAAERKGGKAALESLLNKPRTAAQLQQLTDAECLSEFSKKKNLPVWFCLVCGGEKVAGF